MRANPDCISHDGPVDEKLLTWCGRTTMGCQTIINVDWAVKRLRDGGTVCVDCVDAVVRAVRSH